MAKEEAILFENKAIITNSTLKGQLLEKGIGESKGNKLVLDLFETIFLVEKKDLIVTNNKGKTIQVKKLFELGLKGDKQFYSKQKVHEDLREKGYCIKTGLKFGFDFRVYPRGKKVGETHTEYGIHVASENEKISMTQISRMTRLAGNIHIKTILAVVDREDEVNYYELSRKLF